MHLRYYYVRILDQMFILSVLNDTFHSITSHTIQPNLMLYSPDNYYFSHYQGQLKWVKCCIVTEQHADVGMK